MENCQEILCDKKESGYYLLKTFRLKVSSVPTNVIKDPKDAALFARELFQDLDEDQEHFLILSMNKGNKVTGFKYVASGGISSTDIDLRVIFRSALLLGATAIIAVHNHPSGRIEPSPEDHNITNKILQAGRMLGIRFMDHVILGQGTDQYFSFSEQNLILPAE